MMSFVIDPFLQLVLLIATSILCIGMAAWLRAPIFRSHRSRPAISGKNAASAFSSVVLPQAPNLKIDMVVQHGRIVEIKGTTDPGAVIMINGQPAAPIFPGTEFRHFLGPLPTGTTLITVSCQNEQGGVTTRQIAVNVD